MTTQLNAQKAALRNQIRTTLKTISPAARGAASAQTCVRLKRQKIWEEARTVLFFAPLPEEVDLWPLLVEALADGKTVALPRFVSRTQTYTAARLQNLQTDIRTGQFGIREPAERCVEFTMDRLELVLVPGVAFDLRGRRLGRGRGFYDRMLAEMRGLRCGVAFDEQVVAEVPATEQDECVEILLTPTLWVKTKN